VIRAILSPAKIILVDEATANVDAATDLQVQKVRALRIFVIPTLIKKKIKFSSYIRKF
jgi:ABC-type multidrug transport system fused ATPase/permease subunit